MPITGFIPSVIFRFSIKSSAVLQWLNFSTCFQCLEFYTYVKYIVMNTLKYKVIVWLTQCIISHVTWLRTDCSQSSNPEKGVHFPALSFFWLLKKKSTSKYVCCWRYINGQRKQYGQKHARRRLILSLLWMCSVNHNIVISFQHWFFSLDLILGFHLCLNSEIVPLS